MRTDNERIRAMHSRAGEIKREDRARKVKAAEVFGAAGSMALIAALAFLLPGITGGLDTDVMSGSQRASIFAGSTVLGYIVIGIIAFLLGISVTIFCFHLRKWQEEKDWEDDSPGDL